MISTKDEWSILWKQIVILNVNVINDAKVPYIKRARSFRLFQPPPPFTQNDANFNK